MKYCAVYRCQLCGTIRKLPDEIEISYDELPKVLGKVIQNHQLFSGNPYLHKAPMYVSCKCKDGNAGLALFAGFMQVNN